MATALRSACSWLFGGDTHETETEIVYIVVEHYHTNFATLAGIITLAFALNVYVAAVLARTSVLSASETSPSYFAALLAVLAADRDWFSSVVQAIFKQTTQKANRTLALGVYLASRALGAVTRLALRTLAYFSSLLELLVQSVDHAGKAALVIVAITTRMTWEGTRDIAMVFGGTVLVLLQDMLYITGWLHVDPDQPLQPSSHIIPKPIEVKETVDKAAGHGYLDENMEQLEFGCSLLA